MLNVALPCLLPTQLWPLLVTAQAPSSSGRRSLPLSEWHATSSRIPRFLDGTPSLPQVPSLAEPARRGPGCRGKRKGPIKAETVAGLLRRTLAHCVDLTQQRLLPHEAPGTSLVESAGDHADEPLEALVVPAMAEHLLVGAPFPGGPPRSCLIGDSWDARMISGWSSRVLFAPAPTAVRDNSSVLFSALRGPPHPSRIWRECGLSTALFHARSILGGGTVILAFAEGFPASAGTFSALRSGRVHDRALSFAQTSRDPQASSEVPRCRSVGYSMPRFQSLDEARRQGLLHRLDLVGQHGTRA